MKYRIEDGKQLSTREFQRNFCKLKGEKCSIYDKDGVIVGVYRPINGLENTVRQRPTLEGPKEAQNSPEMASAIPSVTLEQKLAVKSLPSWANGIVQKIPTRAPVIPCIKCKGPAEGKGTFWEDGEEYTIDMCRKCTKLHNIKTFRAF
jgi:hypothetical protein